MYSIKSFDQDLDLIREFKEYLLRLYSNDPFWMQKEEIYPENTRFFLIYKDNKLVGRACGILNPEIKYQDKRTGLIGFYECENDIEASKAIINAIKEYFKENNLEYIIGPMNGSTWQSYRITEPNDNPPFFLDNYHKSWYKEHFLNNNFDIIARYSSTRITNLNKNYDRLSKFEKIYKEKGINVRPFNPDKFEEELNKIYKISIESFKDNFLYTPISFEEVSGLYKKIRGLINPNFVFIAEDLDGEPLGFVFAVDNLLNKDKKSLIAKTVAILPGIKSKGLGSFLVEKIHKAAFDQGYQELFHALMYEYNISTKILADGCELYHTYLLFGKEL